MSETKRKNFTGEFKAKVALKAICGIKEPKGQLRYIFHSTILTSLHLV